MVGSLPGAVLSLQIARSGLLGRRRGSFRGRRGTLRRAVALRHAVVAAVR